eukprot:EC814874.1.p3 GENE.EC814874.1~~EC814874.1.p3  ORF type:complete len:110 (-),score=19.06 EC814874.1:49-378(-)
MCVCACRCASLSPRSRDGVQCTSRRCAFSFCKCVCVCVCARVCVYAPSGLWWFPTIVAHRIIVGPPPLPVCSIHVLPPVSFSLPRLLPPPPRCLALLLCYVPSTCVCCL